jgi:hypothetical protein
MSEFLKKQMGFSEEVTTDAEVEVIQTEETSAEVTAEATQETEVQVETTNEVVQQEEIVTQEVVEETPSKIKVSFKEEFESKEQEIYNYLKEKNTDYSSLKPEELVTLKFKQDNPEFSEEDIREELADKYGIGLQKKQIDPELMTEDEIEQATLYNKQVEKLQRNLKKEAKVAEKYFNEYKESLQLPDLELEVEAKAEKPVLNEEEYIAQYNEQITQQIQKEKEEVWIPEVKKVLDGVESIKKTVEFDDNGNKVVIEVDYKLTAEEKQQSLKFLSDHIVTPYDINTYADVQGLVQGKMAEMNYDKLLKIAIKDAYIKGRTDYVKDKVINYDDRPKSVAATYEPNGDFARESFKASASRRRQG